MGHLGHLLDLIKTIHRRSTFVRFPGAFLAKNTANASLLWALEMMEKPLDNPPIPRKKGTTATPLHITNVVEV